MTAIAYDARAHKFDAGTYHASRSSDLLDLLILAVASVIRAALFVTGLCRKANKSMKIKLEPQAPTTIVRTVRVDYRNIHTGKNGKTALTMSCPVPTDPAAVTAQNPQITFTMPDGHSWTSTCDVLAIRMEQYTIGDLVFVSPNPERPGVRLFISHNTILDFMSRIESHIPAQNGHIDLGTPEPTSDARSFAGSAA